MYVTEKPFDHKRSALIDSLVLEIESDPPPLRLWWLRLRKRVAERHVPTLAPCVRCGQLGHQPRTGPAFCPDCWEVQW